MTVNELCDVLYAASKDRKSVATGLDCLTQCVDAWLVDAPHLVNDLFGCLDMSRCVRAIGQTLLAITARDWDRLSNRGEFVRRFRNALRDRDVPERIVRRMK